MKWPQMGQVSAQTEHYVCNLVIVSWLQTTESRNCEHMLRKEMVQSRRQGWCSGEKAFPYQDGLG